MKSCPTCHRTFEDTLTYCLVDGSILSAPSDPEATQSFQFPQNTEPSKVAQTFPASSPQPNFSTAFKQNQVAEKPRRKGGLIFGVIIVLVLAVGLVIGLGWNSFFGSNNSKARQSESENQNNNVASKTSPTVQPIASTTVTPQSTPSPKSTPSIVKKIDVTGTWTGTFANRDAILFINSQDGDSFSGILKNSKKAIVAISGHINFDTRQISLQENRVVEEATDGPAWILGSDSGSLSTDGKRLSGSGKDKAGHAYTWAFSK
ncbi:MAG: hypothetical protein QOC96_325 [Acidobacteriota bacterium]|jgi:hypothetical protein|nr:hypothetical protein [Acidobacteriota bacterium]